MGFFKTILVIAAIAGAIYAGARWIQRNPSSTDGSKIAPPAYQVPGPQNPYGGGGGGGGNVVVVP